jgi:hypothetical protein
VIGITHIEYSLLIGRRIDRPADRLSDQALRRYWGPRHRGVAATAPLPSPERLVPATRSRTLSSAVVHESLYTSIVKVALCAMSPRESPRVGAIARNQKTLSERESVRAVSCERRANAGNSKNSKPTLNDLPRQCTGGAIKAGGYLGACAIRGTSAARRVQATSQLH